jgi:hypothetical protein
MLQVHELMIAHLCAYLGFPTVAGLGIKQATALENKIDILLREQAKDAYELHCKYPINANLPQEEKIQNLSKLREKSPGSLVVQTLRLGRLIDDSLHRLAFNRESHYEITIKKQDELFCPQDVFSFFLKKVASRTLRESKNGLHIISK